MITIPDNETGHQKITFVCQHHDGTEVTVTTHELDLDGIVKDFTNFLRGCGFHVDSIDYEAVDG